MTAVDTLFRSSADDVTVDTAGVVDVLSVLRDVVTAADTRALAVLVESVELAVEDDVVVDVVGEVNCNKSMGRISFERIAFLKPCRALFFKLEFIPRGTLSFDRSISLTGLSPCLSTESVLKNRAEPPADLYGSEKRAISLSKYRIKKLGRASGRPLRF